MRVIGALCALSLALAVSACGGSSDDGSSSGGRSATGSDEPVTNDSGASDEEVVRETVKAYGTALVEGEGEEACDLVTDELQRAIVTEASAQVSSIESCADAVKVGSRSLSEEAARKLRDPDFEFVKVQGASASVRIKGGNRTPRLTKRSGSWLLSKLH